MNGLITGIPRCFLLNVYDAADYSARTKMAFINIAFSHYAAHVSLKMYQNDMSLMSYFLGKLCDLDVLELQKYNF